MSFEVKTLRCRSDASMVVSLGPNNTVLEAVMLIVCKAETDTRTQDFSEGQTAAPVKR